MTGRVRRRIQAKLDLINHAVYLVTESSPETADRFVDAAEAVCTQLAGQPQMGWQRTFRHHRLSDIRVWRVKGFPDYLIFYLPLSERAVRRYKTDLNFLNYKSLKESITG